MDFFAKGQKPSQTEADNNQPQADKALLTSPPSIEDTISRYFAVLSVIQLLRPKQWTKNIFVLFPLLFSGLVANISAITCSLLAFSCFCLWSSTVYCLNDVVDVTADKKHPRKKYRPVASNKISITAALGLGAVLAVSAGVLAAIALPMMFLGFGFLYLVNSVFYILLLKHRVIIDVLSIAAGFVLRLMAGCSVLQVEPSSWILVCGFSVALLLGFGKRRLEIGQLEQPTQYRAALNSYSSEKLNILLGVTGAICLLSYMLYTVSPETIAFHHTRHLVYTVPFVAYGVFRYMFKVQEGKHDGPVEVLVRDPVFALNGVSWLISVFVVLYCCKA